MKLNYQYAHQSHEESEDKPISKAEDALKAFDDFNWEDQVEKANELQKCSPTLALLLDNHEHMIWVSVVGSKSSYHFVSQCRYLGEVSSFLGFGKKQGAVTLDASSFTKEQARKAISLFISSSYDELRTLYKNT